MHVGHLVYSDPLHMRILDRYLMERLRLTAFVHERSVSAFRRHIPEMEIVQINYSPVDPRNFSQAKVLSHYLDSNGIDLVLFQPDHWSNILSSYFSKRPVRVLAVYHPLPAMGGSFFRGAHRLLYRLDSLFRRPVAFAAADEIIVSSEIGAEITKKMYPDRKDRISFVPGLDRAPVAYGVHNPVLFPQVSRGAKIILLFGRIVRYKGIRNMIRAEPIISESVPDAEIVIAGAGDLRPYLGLINARKEKYIVINRNLTGEEAATLYERASVVVLPYIGSTGTSGVISMAMGHGKPVVVSNVGALPEQVENGKTGLIVPPNDHVALADAVLRLLTDEKLVQFMRHNILQRSAGAWESLAETYVEVFQRALERGKLRP